MPDRQASTAVRCRVAVIWIDWYAYHLARFEGLQSVFGREGQVAGIEMVGGVGVHAGLFFREGRKPGVNVETLLPQSSWGDANKLKLASMIWRRLSELQPEIVLVPGYYTLPAVAAALWAKLHGRTRVLMTESTEGDHVRTPWKETLKASALRLLFDWAVTGGRAHVRYLDALRFPMQRITRFYDVVGNEVLKQSTGRLRDISAAAQHGLPERFFLYVGRLAPEKNVAGLLRSWLAYRCEGGTRPLVLAGDGPEAGSLRKLAASSPFGQEVLFTGQKSAQALIPLFSFAACFVLPSTREPWGLVVNEAMAAGLPVIVSDRCGCAEDLVISGQNGFIFDPTSNEQLTACLHRFEKLSADALSEMGAFSAHTIEPYSPETLAAK